VGEGEFNSSRVEQPLDGATEKPAYSRIDNHGRSLA
jgi:hypothetical protein